MQLNHQLTHLFPLLESANNLKGEHITQFSKQVALNAETTIFRQGDECHNYMLIISGSIKVFSRSENGKIIILYHLSSGSSCVLTTSCLFSNDTYPAEGITETEVVALVIPASIFNEFIEQSSSFRQLVFHSYGNKISSLIALVNTISFSRLDSRIADYILKHSSINTALITTHQDLANELGSAREVISRQLKKFENQRWIKLSRSRIEILNHDALFNLQQQS